MRQIIFANGDVLDISSRSNHLNVIFENVTQEKLLELLAMDQSVWSAFTIRRTTDRETMDFYYDGHALDHVEFKNNDLCFLLREVTEAELNKQALDILLGGAS